MQFGTLQYLNRNQWSRIYGRWSWSCQRICGLRVACTYGMLTEGLSCSFTGFDKSLPPAGVSVVVRPTNEDMNVHLYHVIISAGGRKQLVYGYE